MQIERHSQIDIRIWIQREELEGQRYKEKEVQRKLDRQADREVGKDILMKADRV